MTTGWERPASLNRVFLTGRFGQPTPFALITVAPPAKATLPLGISLRGSEAHSTPACVQGSHLPPLSIPPCRRLLFLFAAFCHIDCARFIAGSQKGVKLLHTDGRRRFLHGPFSAAGANPNHENAVTISVLLLVLRRSACAPEECLCSGGVPVLRRSA